ncbi:Crp/Fnr family transcriptional regulator [Roseivivax sp. CAU 1753]
MTQHARSTAGAALAQALRDAGGVEARMEPGQTAFRCHGMPQAFVFVTEGKLKVHFRTVERQVPWAEYRAAAGQDCMPVTAAILGGCDIRVPATCTTPCVWIALPPAELVRLAHSDPGFQKALFATHAARLPTFFARLSSRNTIGAERLLADWLPGHASEGLVLATHGDIARDLLTAREVVTRRLQDFAAKGWILQERGRIRLDAPAALRRLSRGRGAVRAFWPQSTRRLPV